MSQLSLSKIEDLKVKRDVIGLIYAQDTQDINIQKASANALEQIGVLAVDPLLYFISKGWQPIVTHWKTAVQTLGKISAQLNDAAVRTNVVEGLIVVLTDKDGKFHGDKETSTYDGYDSGGSWDYRDAVAEALGKIGDARAVEPLLAALRSNSSLGVEAQLALIHIGAPAVEPLITQLRNGDEGEMTALVGIGVPAVEPLIAALKESEDNLRCEVAEVLGQIGDARAVEPLIAALKDDYKWTRIKAADALGQIGDARAVEQLSALLEDSDDDIRRHAAMALKKLKG